MRHFILSIAMICALPALADEPKWVPMNGDEIRAALTDRVLSYGTSWQDFRASGRTLYNAGADSWGYWRVQDNQYCSQWPPSDLWACYKMDSNGETLRFIGESGDVTEATYKH